MYRLTDEGRRVCLEEYQRISELTASAKTVIEENT